MDSVAGVRLLSCNDVALTEDEYRFQRWAGRNDKWEESRGEGLDSIKEQSIPYTASVAEWLCEKVDAVAVSGASVAEGQGGQSTVTAQEQREV